MYREFLVHYRWNGYDRTEVFTLNHSQKANPETFKELALAKENDSWGMETIIHSWSLIEQ